MADITLICGKICSGKSHYAKDLAEKTRAVVLSCDEISADIFHHSEGTDFDAIAGDIKAYLHKISARIAKNGGRVILDWGFWKKAERKAVTEYYASLELTCEWLYIDISEDEWQHNIFLRNKAVAVGETTDFYVDDGLMAKLAADFEAPDCEEIDRWIRFSRD